MLEKEVGIASNEAPTFKLSKTPAELRSPAHFLGEHTEYVCTKILVIPDDGFIQLLRGGVFD